MKTILKFFLICCLLSSGSLCAQSSSTPVPKWKLADLQQAMDAATQPTIFNFWATFCKPCIAEIPHFQELVKKYESAGVKLVLVSLDLPEAYSKIRPFAIKRKFTAPIVFLDETNADLFCPAVDESWSGAIPATLLLNPKKGYRKFFEEEMSQEKLEKEIRLMIE